MGQGEKAEEVSGEQLSYVPLRTDRALRFLRYLSLSESKR
jgi:hypothetical protein